MWKTTNEMEGTHMKPSNRLITALAVLLLMVCANWPLEAGRGRRGKEIVLTLTEGRQGNLL